LEYTNPSLKLSTYPDRESRFTDTIFTYIFSIIFIYFITAYLLNSYIKEKKLAKERADAIQSQNEILKDIAWMQSHKIRSHVATIMGLTDILESHPDDPDNKNIIKNIKSVAHDLDHVIRDINDLTNEKP
jgi:signal transduction histidine kinase